MNPSLTKSEETGIERLESGFKAVLPAGKKRQPSRTEPIPEMVVTIS
jgi:hypothetical protein